MDFPKNKKMGYPTLILLSTCVTNSYKKITYTGTYTGTYTETHTGTLTETHTEPALKPSLKNTVLGSGQLTLVSQNPGDDDTNETN